MSEQSDLVISNWQRAALDARPTPMEPVVAIAILQRMRTSNENLMKAVRWPHPSNRWTEAEKVTAEHDYSRRIEALDLAIDTLSLLTTAPL